MATHRLFVYGTLKRGQPNEEQFGAEYGVAKYVGQARTVAKWPLVIASTCNVPYLLDIEGTGCQIYGEVYEIDDKMLQHCDEFEACPVYYQRVPIQVQLTEDSAGSKLQGGGEEVYVYVLRDYKEFLLKLPYFENYDSNGPHGLKYRPKYERLREEESHLSQVKKC